MKTKMQSNPNWKVAVTLLAAGAMLSVLILDVRGGKPAPYTPMCVEFDDLPDDRVKSDGAVYCDHEGRTVAGIT